jgi:N-acyl-D-amino-acid deacylase
LEKLEKIGLPLNFGTCIGHGNIRASILGYDARAPTNNELDMMRELVREGIIDGTFGLSSGLKYAPKYYAETHEIIELCKVVTEYGGLYASHIRNQGDQLVESVDEAIRVGKEAEIRVIISHLKVKGRDNWGKSSNILRIIEDSREKGIDVTYDQYPYPAGSSNLISRTPRWSREGGPDKLLERLRDPKLRAKIESEIVNSEDWYGPETTYVAGFEPDAIIEGKSLAEISEIREKPPVQVVSDLLIEADGFVPVISFYGWEEDVINIMKHNCMLVGSDGSSLSTYGVLGQGKPHPRNYGTFPRFLGKYVIREKTMSLEEGIRKMTSNPATRLGLKDRGYIKRNMMADIVIFDHKKLIDKATFENPHQYPIGIEYVIVNGKITVEKGEYKGMHNGKVLRHSFNNEARKFIKLS